MDYKIVWTDEALTDVEDIAEYISRDSFYYAGAVVTNIINTTKNLESYPFAGSVVPEENHKFLREHLVYSYRIIYEIRETTVYVLAVVHGSRLLSPVLKERI